MICILQGVVPDYRKPLFAQLAKDCSGILVYAGREYFAKSVVDAASGERWHRMLRNRYILGRRLLWQQGTIVSLCFADVVMMELNPRIMSSWLLAAIRRLGGRRTLFWGHVGKIAEGNSILGRLRRLMLESGDGFVAYTEAEAALLRRRDYRRQIWITNNSCLHRAQCTFSAGRQRRTIVYVGRLVVEKKVDLLVRAFALAARSLPEEVKLLIVGDGPQRRELDRMVVELGITARIEFAGHRSDPDFLSNAYAAAFVAASPGYVGLSVIQALGNGVPMLVARDELHSPEIEACREGLNTVYFPSDDVTGAAHALEQFWANRERWEAMGATIASHIAQRYTYEAMAEALVGAIRGMAEPTKLGNRGAAGLLQL